MSKKTAVSSKNSKKVVTKESDYLAKLIDEDTEESNTETESESESNEDDVSVEEEEESEEEGSETTEDAEAEEDVESDDDDSGSEKGDQTAPLEWIDDSVLEKTDKIIITGDTRVMSDRVTINEFALITSMRIAQIEAGSPIFLKHNPYTSTREIALAELRENSNQKDGNCPLMILRHSHSNIWEEWKISDMSIPGIMFSGSIIATGDDE